MARARERFGGLVGAGKKRRKGQVAQRSNQEASKTHLAIGAEEGSVSFDLGRVLPSVTVREDREREAISSGRKCDLKVEGSPEDWSNGEEGERVAIQSCPGTKKLKDDSRCIHPRQSSHSTKGPSVSSSRRVKERQV